MRAIVLPLAGLLCAATHAQAADAPPAGEKWQVTASVEAMGMKMPGQTSTVCTTHAHDAPPIEKRDNCETYDVQRSGNTMSFKMRCTGREAMEGSGSITFSGDSYHGAMQASAGGHSMNMTWDGTKLGACDGSEANVRAEKLGKQVQQQVAVQTQQTCAASAREGASPYMFMPGPTGICKDDAASKQLYCRNFQSYRNFDQAAKAEAGGGMPPGMGKPLTDSATLCNVPVEQVRKNLCGSAVNDHQLEFLSAHCPAEKAAIVQRECAGRSYSTVADAYRSFCAGALSQGDESGQQGAQKPDAKPEAKPSLEDKLKKGKDKLKSLFGS